MELGTGATSKSAPSVYDTKWISGTTPTTVKGLPSGTYTLTETQVPDGYSKAESITFTIQGDKIVSVFGGTYDEATGKITMVDKKSVGISKVLAGGGSELPGAKLTLSAVNGNDKLKLYQSNFADQQGTSEDDGVISWTSGTTPKYLINLPDGTYTLHEEATPDDSMYGYAEDMTFVIESGKVISVNGKEVTSTNNLVVMEDSVITKGTLKFSKKDVYGDELSGASLVLTSDNDMALSQVGVTLGTGATGNGNWDGSYWGDTSNAKYYEDFDWYGWTK